jgi:hypothetical protein
MERASDSPEFRGAFETVHAWRVRTLTTFGSDADQPMPPEVAVARASLERMRLGALEAAGREFQRAVDIWREGGRVLFEGTSRAHLDWTPCGSGADCGHDAD